MSLRLLAGLVKTDLQQPGDIAAARRLDVSGDLVQRQHHVLATAYDSLPPGHGQLLSRIACFRGPVGYEALAAVAAAQKPRFSLTKPGSPEEPFAGNEPLREEKKLGFSEGALDAALVDLIDRGLLHHHTASHRFDLHPLVRHYSYYQLASDQRRQTHAQLLDYFASIPQSDEIHSLTDLSPFIELYFHTLKAGQYDEAWRLFYDRINQATYYQFGAYQLRIELLLGLFPDGDPTTGSGQGISLPRLKKESDQGWTLNALANSYSLSGQPLQAVPVFQAAADMAEKQGNKSNLAIGLGNLASMAQIYIGTLRAAEANLHRQIDLCREIGDERSEAVGHQDLGRLLAYRGAWEEAERELAAALKLAERIGHVQGQGIIWATYSLLALLLVRAAPFIRSGADPSGRFAAPNPSPLRGEGDRSTGRASGAPLPEGEELGERESLATALHAARRSLEQADETARTQYPYARDYMRAHWLLGAAYRVNGNHDDADRHLSEALTRCRGINVVDHEADILLDLARLRREQVKTGGSFGPEPQDDRMGEPLRLAQEALAISERSGYVLQGADVRLFLAQLALDAGDRAAALKHARQARQLAACDGPPDYTYKVAYDEAGALVAALEAIHE